jgi:hypothetical protein
VSTSNDSGGKADEQILYDEGYGEIAIATNIVKAVQGNLSGATTTSKHIKEKNLDQTWERVKQEIGELEEDLRNGDLEAVDRVEDFLMEDSQNVEQTVAYLIGSYLLARDGMEKVYSANRSAPHYLQDNFDVEGQKEKVENIAKAVYNMLSEIDSGVETAYSELRAVENDHPDDKIEDLLRFFSEMHTSIQDFKEGGEIDEPIKRDIKEFIREEKKELEQRKREKREEANQYHRSVDRGRF